MLLGYDKSVFWTSWIERPRLVSYAKAELNFESINQDAALDS
jgi:hypothetical protein